LVVKWRTLVLFTALFMIKEVYKHIFRLLKENNINLYAQWIAWWKHKLINFYKKNVWNSVLLGTDTFWEGIDLSWDDLRYLIIHKIPFMVPNDPIFQARSSLFNNSFSEYSLPKAILKLKQWFWRLIRTKNDSWIIVFLDDRIYSTSWWNSLFSAFPKDIKYKKWDYNLLINVLKNKNIEL
jgi:ATP-dependent DNA helicase DinG